MDLEAITEAVAKLHEEVMRLKIETEKLNETAKKIEEAVCSGSKVF